LAILNYSTHPLVFLSILFRNAKQHVASLFQQVMTMSGPFCSLESDRNIAQSTRLPAAVLAKPIPRWNRVCHFFASTNDTFFNSKVLKLYRNVARQMPLILQIYNIQVVHFSHMTRFVFNCTVLFFPCVFNPPFPTTLPLMLISLDV
jgi:hypothetical protein